MNCLKLENVVSLYLAGELDSERTAAVEEHLRSCPTCAREIDRQKDIDAFLCEGVLREPIDSTPLERRVKQAIHSEVRTFTRRFTFRRGLGAAAAIAVIAFGSVTAYQHWVFASPVYAAFSHDHTVEVTGQAHRTWFTDRAKIDDVVSQQGIAPAVLDTLAPSSYHLRQVKLCPLNGSRYLHLVYSDGVHTLSIYLHPADETRLTGFALDSENGKLLHSAHIGQNWLSGFHSDSFTAMVVTDQSASEALFAARSVARAL